MSNLVRQAVERLRHAGVELAHGLSDHEVRRIEKSFRFTFSPEHRELLITVFPSGESWPDWRDGSRQDLQARLDWPVAGVLFDFRNNGFWPASWGERPSDSRVAEDLAREQLARVPRLVPIYSHRYLAAGRTHAPSPVFSVYQTDVIYYGDDLLDYVAHEFKVPPLHPLQLCERVQFWSDLAEGVDAGDL